MSSNVGFSKAIPLIPGPATGQGLTLLYMEAPTKERIFFLAGINYHSEVERPEEGEGLYVMDADGNECPQSDLKVLGHLPITVEGIG